MAQHINNNDIDVDVGDDASDSDSDYTHTSEGEEDSLDDIDEEVGEEEDAEGQNAFSDHDPKAALSGMAPATRTPTLAYQKRWLSTMLMLQQGGAL